MGNSIILSSKRVALAFAILSAFALFPVESADAGVLIPHVRSLSNIRVPRVTRWRVRSSTAAARQMNPLHRGSLGGPSDDLEMAEAYYKYQQKLYRWELKRQRKAERDLRRKLREQETARKKLEKQQLLLAKKQGQIRVQNPDSSSGDLKKSSSTGNFVSSLFGKSDSNQGKVFVNQGENQDKPKLSFWAKLRKALIGR